MAASWVNPSRDHLSAGIKSLTSKAQQFRHQENAGPIGDPHTEGDTEGDTEEGRKQARQTLGCVLRPVCVKQPVSMQGFREAGPKAQFQKEG